MSVTLSIHKKLALILWGFALLTYVVVGAGVIVYQNYTLEQRAAQAMDPYVRFVAVGAETAVAFEDAARAKEILDTLQANSQIVQAALFLEDGRILSGFGDRRDFVENTTKFGITKLGKTIELRKSLSHGAQLYLTMNLEQFKDKMHRVVWGFGVGLILLLAITFGQMAVLRRAILVPVTNLAAAVETVRLRDEYDQHLPIEGDNEIATLAKNFNAMMQAVKIRDRDLRHLALFQQTVVDSAAYGIISCDMDGLVTSFNKAAERLLGYNADEIVAKQSVMLWHDPKELEKRARELSGDNGEPIPTGLSVLTTLANQGLADEYEWTFLRKDGTRVSAFLSFTVLKNERGDFTGYVGLAYDLTERKKLEDKLLQSQKMEAIGLLAGGVAHDFNNMLGVITGYTELSLDRDDLDSTLRKDLESILNAAHRSAEITRQLLAFARKQTVSPVVLDLNACVKGTLKMLRRLIGEDIELVWAPAQELPPIKIDSSQVDQILVNLCVNAKDAIGGVGTISIKTGKFVSEEGHGEEQEGLVPGEYVQLVISDSGCGMDQATKERIFEPFFTTKETGKGTGMGLATVYGIVKQNGGTISVYSEPDHGTTFKLLFPRHRAEKVRPNKSTKIAADCMGSETVLVVEDEAAYLQVTSLFLETYGYHVLTAAKPSDAIEAAQNHPEKIHLLLTDLVMPEMNGRELAEKISSICPNILRLYMSGYSGDIIVHQDILDKEAHFIPKPFSKIDLAKKVREVLDGVAELV